jgi:1-phosphofructokinase
MLIAGPNATIDRTLTIAELRPGEVLRFEDVAVTPGGKGLNVARAARALGAPAVLVSFVAGHTGRAGAAMVAAEGIELGGVPSPGELRSTAVILEASGRTTVLNEPGPEIGPADWEAYERELGAHLAGHGVLVCSGSVPPGSPPDAYGRLAALARAGGLLSVVDAGGETLEAALTAGADVVTPNLGEAEDVLGRRGGGEQVEAAHDARPRALAAAEALVARGARAAVVTAAAAGAALACADAAPAPADPTPATADAAPAPADPTPATADAAPAPADAAPLWMPAPIVAAVRNPVGAGDVLASGLAAALERGEPLPAALRAGIAAAAASVESPTAGELDPERARALAAAMTA